MPVTTNGRLVDGQVHLYEPAASWPTPWTPAHPWTTEFLAQHPSCTIEQMLPIWDAAGVATGVQVTPLTYGFDNRYSIDIARRHPDRVVIFARFDVLAPDPRDRLLALARSSEAILGLRLTLHVEPDHLAFVQPLDEFWATVQELSMPVAIFAPGNLDWMCSVLERFPDLVLIIDHLGLGGSSLPDDIELHRSALERIARFPRARAKVTNLTRFSRGPFPYHDVHPLLRSARDTFGADRLIWGSDYPAITVKGRFDESLRYLEEVDDISAADREWITGRSLATLIEETRARRASWPI